MYDRINRKKSYSSSETLNKGTRSNEYFDIKNTRKGIAMQYVYTM